jgi:hypothetical protein
MLDTTPVHHQFVEHFEVLPFVGFAYQGNDIMLRFIIEYRSLMDFGPLGNNNRSIFTPGFWKDDIFWLVLKLEISCRGVIS